MFVRVFLRDVLCCSFIRKYEDSSSSISLSQDGLFCSRCYSRYLFFVDNGLSLKAEQGIQTIQGYEVSTFHAPFKMTDLMLAR